MSNHEMSITALARETKHRILKDLQAQGIQLDSWGHDSLMNRLVVALSNAKVMGHHDVLVAMNEAARQTPGGDKKDPKT